jgi:hypothetical protein
VSSSPPSPLRLLSHWQSSSQEAADRGTTTTAAVVANSISPDSPPPCKKAAEKDEEDDAHHTTSHAARSRLDAAFLGTAPQGFTLLYFAFVALLCSMEYPQLAPTP